jgi:seryl-tRNA synthetase
MLIIGQKYSFILKMSNFKQFIVRKVFKMLDIKKIRENPEAVKKALSSKGVTGFVDEVLDLDKQRRKIIVDVEQLKARRNDVSKQIPMLKKAGKDVAPIMVDMKKVGEDIKSKDADLNDIDSKMKYLLMSTPNLPSDTTPIGKDETENVQIKTYGTPEQFDFEPKAHWELGENLQLLDFEKAANISGSRFVIYKGKGAKLERALINFMLDTHSCENGYTEIMPPYIVKRHTMEGTGQLPKFEQDAFKLSDGESFLIPTAEVPVTNMYRKTTLDVSELPIAHTAYTACFRSEAGSAGRDTRGLIRLHQFNKVELVRLCKPEDSYDELELLLSHAESILQELELPYRVITLCTGDTGFSAAKTYDIEVWMPSYGRYVEISSCSNCEDFQARRADIKFKRDIKAKPEFVHTLNGSGLAVGRTFAAIIENNQREDGSVKIPLALQQYLSYTSLKLKK